MKVCPWPVTKLILPRTCLGSVSSMKILSMVIVEVSYRTGVAPWLSLSEILPWGSGDSITW